MAWLSDLCQERDEVREKKTSKKRPKGLKAMGSMESDSERGLEKETKMDNCYSKEDFEGVKEMAIWSVWHENL
ncbi:hypothetical protein RJ639_011123 [Escallonia herrerae]|uniref:Uncharacterized protein n=1 Tax=Escallonia herrerae TaxID=1293975 RepID=A0AA89AQ90_9ASTE|nr:hypothetical protein RJ639_011123 [Escallonia herrerae]